MARVRQALRCTACRSDGSACGAYAITGGTVCMAHGGSAPAVRAAAARRVERMDALRQFEAAKARWRRDLARWQARRIAVTARLMSIPPGRVTRGDILACQFLHGQPAGDPPPMRSDRRYGRRRRPAAAR